MPKGVCVLTISKKITATLVDSIRFVKKRIALYLKLTVLCT